MVEEAWADYLALVALRGGGDDGPEWQRAIIVIRFLLEGLRGRMAPARAKQLQARLDELLAEFEAGLSQVGYTPDAAETVAARIGEAVQAQIGEAVDPQPSAAEPTPPEPPSPEPPPPEPPPPESDVSAPPWYQPAAVRPAPGEPSASEPTAGEPTESEPTESEPTQGEPPWCEPAASEPTTSEPAASESAASEPTASEPAIAERAAPKSAPSDTVPAVEKAFEPLPEPAVKRDRQPDLDLEAAAAEEAKLSEAEAVILESLRGAVFGSWYEFADIVPGSWVRRKLAWYSTVTGHCLLTDGDGQGTETTLANIARRVHSGHARPFVPSQGNLLDRALNVVLSRLKIRSDGSSETSESGSAA